MGKELVLVPLIHQLVQESTPAVKVFFSRENRLVGVTNKMAKVLRFLGNCNDAMTEELIAKS